MPIKAEGLNSTETQGVLRSEAPVRSTAAISSCGIRPEKPEFPGGHPGFTPESPCYSSEMAVPDHQGYILICRNAAGLNVTDDDVFHSFRPNWYVVPLLIALGASGCALTSDRDLPRTNALLIPSSSLNATWEQAVSVLHRNHFLIARESKLEGVIETEYRAGSNLLEPWHHDSVGFDNRLESTLQSIRRKVVITFGQSGADQLMVSVQAYKEIEDVPGPTATYEGGATFSESRLLERDLDQVVGQSSVSRWLPRGRDPHLESRLIAQIQGVR